MDNKEKLSGIDIDLKKIACEILKENSNKNNIIKFPIKK